MADMERIVVVWTGVSGLPGVSVFFGDVAGSANADIKAYFSTMSGSFPTGLSWQIPGNGDLVDDATGGLTGAWTNTGGGGTVTASGNAAHASGCGAYVNWQTSGIINGRRLKGRTFLAPLVAVGYDNQGTIVSGTLTNLQTAANTLVAAGSTRIWHRPNGGPGTSVQPFAATVPDQVTSLKTRRR